MTLFQTACAKSDDLCNISDFTQGENGWVVTHEIGNVRYIEFSTKKSELEAGVPPIQPEMMVHVARDAAIASITNAYSQLVPPPSKDSDLSISHMESFLTKCNLDFRYTFRVPVSNLRWVLPNLDKENDSMAPAKRLLEEMMND